ncbi:MAG: hypothetical protein JXR10_17890 [Cyclobacteriaceae bacterium]
MEYVLGGIFIIGIIGLIATVIKYPKDVGRGILATLLLPFERMMDFLSLLLLPIILIVPFIEGLLGVNFFTKLIDRESRATKKKTTQKKDINFKN